MKMGGIDTSMYLRKATSRAKSDVANKMVSMFLHGFSRLVVAEIGLAIKDPEYIAEVTDQFGDSCCYCARILEKDRIAVEHLEGMNRFRVGLHIPGNVLLSCKACNLAKRRDDSLVNLVLADSGWESFLSHNSLQCDSDCKSCGYWREILPDESSRKRHLVIGMQKISTFRKNYDFSLVWAVNAHKKLKTELDAIYRECQDYATDRINSAVENSFKHLKN